MNAAIHYTSSTYGLKTACGRDIQRVACWDDRDAITCKRCVAAMNDPVPLDRLQESNPKRWGTVSPSVETETPHPPAVQCAVCARYFDTTVSLQAHGSRTHGADFDWRDEKPKPAQVQQSDTTARVRQLAERISRPMTPLEKLDDVTSIIEAAELLRTQLVDLARAQGDSWTKIGQSLGLTKQAAQQRYGKKPAPTPATETPLPGMES